MRQISLNFAQKNEKREGGVAGGVREVKHNVWGEPTRVGEVVVNFVSVDLLTGG